MPSMSEITRDCFNTLSYLQSLGSSNPAELPSPQVLHQRMIALIDQVEVAGRQSKFTDKDITDVRYAIVALADETALRQSADIRNYWMSRPLQLHYFQENLAGEGFFRRMRALLGDPTRIDILKVFYTCLCFGFVGKFGARGREMELEKVRQQVERSLKNELAEQPISRRQERPRERSNNRSKLSIPLMVALFAILFSLAFVFALRIMLNKQSEKSQNLIETKLEALRGPHA